MLKMYLFINVVPISLYHFDLFNTFYFKKNIYLIEYQTKPIG